MAQKVKTVLAIFIPIVLAIVAIILDVNDRTTDVFPDENTQIRLYGETHGQKEFYNLEVKLWKGYYDEGYRNLFVELPYYSAEFLNLWMKEDSDELIDQWFEEIQGTLSSNSYSYEFWHEIKELCPETVFYGTDVGHQYYSTGQRYLEYLEKEGLTDSENYTLAKECISQGEQYRVEDTNPSGISTLREGYMISNFIDAYDRCGGGKIMGIYGDYHTNLSAPDRMAAGIKNHYGESISSVDLDNMIFGKHIEPYRIGISISGIIFLIMLFVPNIIWARRGQPEGYAEQAKKENRVLLTLERIGEVLVSTCLVVFPAIDPHVRYFRGNGVFFEYRVIIWLTAFVLMVLYECYWIRYFRSKKTLSDLYSSFAGYPVAGASLPVIAVLLLGIHAGNLIIIASSIVLGIGHIGIHLEHKKNIPDESKSHLRIV